jgi:predicted metal-dependent hydrolase
VQSYKVRTSERARYVRLKLSATDGLTVIIPEGFDESKISSILLRKRAWIDGALERFAEQREFSVERPIGPLPKQISLLAIGQEWTLTYRPTQSSTVTAVERPGRELLVFGNVGDESATRAALKRWLSRIAHQHIVPWIKRLSTQENLHTGPVLVKAQRTRWASCSARRTISVNMRLLFLSERLVRYVLVHELAHTIEMSHSRRFWSLVRALDLNYQRHDAELRSAWRLVPMWIGLWTDCRSELL